MKFYITYISKDPFALYKSVETIRPHFILVLISEKAKKDNWEQRVFEYFERSKIKFSHFDISPYQNNIHDFIVNIDGFMKQLVQKEFNDKNIEIICDQTNGVGLLRAASLMYFDSFSKRNNYSYYITFADGDSNNVRICKTDTDINKIVERSMPVKLYENKNAFEEYFSLYLGSKNKLESSNVNINKDLNQVDLDLLKTLKERASFRLLFTSWLDMINQYDYLKHYRDYEELIFSDYNKAVDSFCIGLSGKIILRFETVLMNKNYDSVKLYLKSQDVKKKICEISFTRDYFLIKKQKEVIFENVINRLVTKIHNNSKVKRMFENSFKGQLEGIINSCIVVLKNDFKNKIKLHIDIVAKKEFLNHYYQNRPYLQNYKDFFKGSVGFNFEEVVEFEVRRIINNNINLKNSINTVCKNVRVYKNGTNVLEADLLLMFNNGMNLVIEVKTNCEMAKKKDMDARAKNISDIMGIKSKLIVVYPFSRKDFTYLSTYNSDSMVNDAEYAEFWKYGIPELDKWRAYIKTASQNKDMTLCGFDEIESFINKIADNRR